jgi:hypothetical protein
VPSAIRTATPLITCKAFGCMIVLAITWQRTLGVHTVSFGTLGESDHYCYRLHPLSCCGCISFESIVGSPAS